MIAIAKFPSSLSDRRGIKLGARNYGKDAGPLTVMLYSRT